MKARGDAIVMLTAYDFTMAALCDESGVDVVLVGDSVATVVQGHETTVLVTIEQMLYHSEMVARGCKRALVIGDMPFLSYQISTEEALRNAGRFLKEARVEAVKLEGGAAAAPTVARLVQAGIPVMGHLGLTPQSIHVFGTYRTRGTDAGEAQRIRDDAIALEQAGVFAIVLEKVPQQLAREITARIGVPTIGIGAGVGCDGQVLVGHDMLGLFTKWKPRFVRRYADLGASASEAMRRYCEDVRLRRFPSDAESY